MHTQHEMHHQGPSLCVLSGPEPRPPGPQWRPLGPCKEQLLPVVSPCCVHVVRSCLHTFKCAVPSEEWSSLSRVGLNKPVKTVGGWQHPGATRPPPLTPFSLFEHLRSALSDLVVVLVKMLAASGCAAGLVACLCLVCGSRASVLSENEPRWGGRADAPTGGVLHTFSGVFVVGYCAYCLSRVHRWFTTTAVFNLLYCKLTQRLAGHRHSVNIC